MMRLKGPDNGFRFSDSLANGGYLDLHRIVVVQHYGRTFYAVPRKHGRGVAKANGGFGVWRLKSMKRSGHDAVSR